MYMYLHDYLYVECQDNVYVVLYCVCNSMFSSITTKDKRYKDCVCCIATTMLYDLIEQYDSSI